SNASSCLPGVRPRRLACPQQSPLWHLCRGLSTSLAQLGRASSSVLQPSCSALLIVLEDQRDQQPSPPRSRDQTALPLVSVHDHIGPSDFSRCRRLTSDGAAVKH